MKNLKFSPGDTNYRWDRVSDSPYLKRSSSPPAFDSFRDSQFLVVKKRYYALFFSNVKESYLSRNQQTPTKNSLREPSDYLLDSDLIGDVNQIRFSMNKLLDHIILKLEKDPHCLYLEVDTINAICDQEGVTIPFIETFQRLKNWDEFLDLLASLHHNNSPFKFELMIAAMNQYSALCS